MANAPRFVLTVPTSAAMADQDSEINRKLTPRPKPRKENGLEIIFSPKTRNSLQQEKGSSEQESSPTRKAAATKCCRHAHFFVPIENPSDSAKRPCEEGSDGLHSHECTGSPKRRRYQRRNSKVSFMFFQNMKQPDPPIPKKPEACPRKPPSGRAKPWASAAWNLLFVHCTLHVPVDRYPDFLFRYHCSPKDSYIHGLLDTLFTLNLLFYYITISFILKSRRAAAKLQCWSNGENCMEIVRNVKLEKGLHLFINVISRTGIIKKRKLVSNHAKEESCYQDHARSKGNGAATTHNMVGVNDPSATVSIVWCVGLPRFFE